MLDNRRNRVRLPSPRQPAEGRRRHRWRGGVLHWVFCREAFGPAEVACAGGWGKEIVLPA